MPSLVASTGYAKIRPAGTTSAKINVKGNLRINWPPE
jgi:hypothetical protein